ncbi:MAG: ECF transporter S component [Clostridia bacterium]|nr:ECF transporter S component [Clostridia bacterium]
MKKASSLYAVSLSKPLAFTAVFAALCCIGTVVIAIPWPVGYFNVGDVFVLLAGWCLGPIYGPIAAGTGSAIADIVSGFPLYVPATFFIKALDALIAYTVWFFLKKCFQKEKFDFIPRIFATILGESVMITGYLLYDSILYGFSAAFGGLFGNVMQGVFCGLIAILTVAILYHTKAARKWFPSLECK